jgi:putative PIN family toxin of toxin-antitoxin system
MTARASVVSRVVIDTSTLVSAALRKRSIPRQALDLAIRHCELCVSRQTLDELHEVLNRRKFDRYLAPIRREEFLHVLESGVRILVVRDGCAASAGIRCRDATDQKFLDLAWQAEAETIVSSDEDLLVLNPWNDIRIVRPATFVDMIGELA